MRMNNKYSLFVNVKGEPIAHKKLPWYKIFSLKLYLLFRTKPIKIHEGNTIKYLIPKDIKYKK